MLKNYFKSAYRNFVRHKSFTFLNVSGLALGLSASLMIIQYVKYERSFDSFHSNAENIYRIQYNNYQNGSLSYECAAAVPAVGPEMKNNFPEIIRFTRLYPVSGVITYNSPELGIISFKEDKMQIADQRVFQVFDFELVEGNPETCLEGPNKAVISQSAAQKYFQDEDPIGKTIKWGSEREYEITGIMEDVPDNSHIKFNILFSFQTLNNETENASEESWGWYDFNTYVQVQEGVEIKELQAKWDKHLQEVRGEAWEHNNFKQEFLFQPLLNIHLYSNLLQESQPQEQGDGQAVYFLGIVAFFILIIAWVNYINLSTAKSFERANEVGVRKVMGAVKSQLRNQFIIESFLINLMALIIAILIIILAWPSFTQLTGRPIPFTMIYEPSFWLLATGLFASGTLLSGFYPAWMLSSFKPIAVLKGKSTIQNEGSFLRKGLVVFQFFASVTLISGTLIVWDQLRFMKNMDLGIDIRQTLVLESPGMRDSLYSQSVDAFKNEVLRINGVGNVSANTNVPGDEIFWTRGIRRLTGGPESHLTSYIVGIDENYIPAFNLNVIAGRNFSKDFPSDEDGIIINRSLANSIEYINLEEAISEKVSLGGDTLNIIGVIEDYHQMSLKNKTAPIVMRYSTFDSFYALKINSDSYQSVLAGVNGVYNQIFPGNPVNYFFLDEFFNKQYDSDRQFGQVFSLFSILAIFVACLGLFGLASFMTTQRTKEVGIRKALGSSVGGIAALLSGSFIKLVIVGAILATPVAWIIMSQWLESFPYHIKISPLVFLLSWLMVILIALASVAYQTITTALLNPAKTLRYE
jgi:putative ABC transport system permease protein